MRVKVVYLGMLREIAGCEREVVELRDASTAADLYTNLQQRLPKLQDFRGAIALAVNYEYAAGTVILHENDEVALIPPVSGGSGEVTVAGAAKLALASQHAALVTDAIEPAPILEQIKRPEDGAVAIFDGIVRNNSRGRKTLYLDYSGYERDGAAPNGRARHRGARALRDPGCAYRPSLGPLTDWRDQRLHSSCVGASGGGLRRLPLAHRYAEDHRADLEEGAF